MTDATHTNEKTTASTCECHYKSTPRSAELTHDLKRRLHRIAGQVSGVEAMVDDGRYCGDVLTQLAAIEKAVRAVSAEVLQDHLETCVVERVQAGDTEVMDEVMTLVRRFS